MKIRDYYYLTNEPRTQIKGFIHLLAFIILLFYLMKIYNHKYKYLIIFLMILLISSFYNIITFNR